MAPLLALPPDRLRDVVVSAYHSWEISRHHIIGIEPARNLVYLTGHYSPTFFHYTASERYILENYREPDGSVTVPDVLHAYMRGVERITGR